MYDVDHIDRRWICMRLAAGSMGSHGMWGKSRVASIPPRKAKFPGKRAQLQALSSANHSAHLQALDSFTSPNMELYREVVDVASNPKHSRWVANALVAGEVVLCGGILVKIPYTEIDWTTYMQQVQLFLDGECHYGKLKGDTGPLVYPALHVYIYSALYYLTDRGTNIFRAQCIFALLYLTTLAFVLACYRRTGAPPWLLIPLVLSKRLHSIFLLRLFNDGWATLCLWISIWALQKRLWPLGATVWGAGLGIKMTMLMAAPPLAAIAIQAVGVGEAFFLGTFIIIVQACLAFPFLNNQIGTGFIYFERAFDFGRQFLYKWTVNWRFVEEKIFLSREFAIGLLIVHVSTILYFMENRWVKPSSSSIKDFVKKYTGNKISYDDEQAAEAAITPTFVMDSILGSVAIGMLCARSLHYQFYAYLGWASPYLLWRLGAGPAWVLTNMLVQEMAWLQYPSTNASSAVVVAELAIQVLCVLYGSGSRADDKLATKPKAIEKKTG